jgi:hypothetical protein
MLTELAFLPSVFDAAVNAGDSKWDELLRACIQYLRVPNLAAHFVISDLYNGSWRHEVESIVNSIPEQRARRLCKDFVTLSEKLLVKRPCSLDSYPNDESAWAREAHLSHAISPIDRIVVARESCVKAKAECPSVRTLHDVGNVAFWNDAFGARSLRLDVDEQVRAVGKVLLHSEWIAIVDPYVLNDDDGFAEVLFRQACQLRTRFGPVRLEVHTCMLELGPDGQRRRCEYLSSRFHRHARSGDRVEVFYWPQILDRRLLGGALTTREGVVRKKKRWCVSITHSARPSDRRCEDVAFALLSDEAPGRNAFDLFVADEAAGKPRAYRLV